MNLLAQRWDYIFFTGSVAVGSCKRQQNILPCHIRTWKNPCIIDETANLKLAAKKLFGKMRDRLALLQIIS
jgi:aldehyde dehydrogenase (NAD+)